MIPLIWLALALAPQPPCTIGDLLEIIEFAEQNDRGPGTQYDLSLIYDECVKADTPECLRRRAVS